MTDEDGAPEGQETVEQAQERRARWGRRRGDRVLRPDWRLAITILLAVAGGLLLVTVVEATFVRLQGLLLAVIVSLFLSFAMEPAVQWLARRGVRRGFATGAVLLLLAAGLAGFVAAMAPVVRDQVETLFQEGPGLLSNLSEQARRLPGGLGDAVAEYLDQATLPAGPDEAGGGGILSRFGSGILGFGSTVVGVIVQLLTISLVTFYLVADGPRLRRAVLSRMPAQRQQDLLEIWELAVDKTGGYVYSRLLIAIASAIFHGAVFSMIALPYSIALGLWVGVVSSLIPVIGTYLAGALPLIVGLAIDPVKALWVLLAVVTYQQIENYLVQPRITSHTMALHPALAFLSVLAGAALFGAAGALLALPAVAIVAALVSAVGERHEIVSHQLLMTSPRAPVSGGPPSRMRRPD